MQEARKRRRQSPWFGLGMFGLVGWAVAVPIVVGTALGRWIDARWPGDMSWTLALLLAGAFWARSMRGSGCSARGAMTEGVALPILSLLAGAVFGLLYLGVLWGAVRLLTSGQSVWLFAATALLRAGLLLGALWLAAIMGATAAEIAFALLGFVAVRLFATRMAKAAPPEQSPWK